MISFILSVLFVSAGAFAMLVLADSAVRGLRAYRVVKADLIALSPSEPERRQIAIAEPILAERRQPAVRAIRVSLPRATPQQPFFARLVAA